MRTLEKKQRTKEHIPAKPFFVGYPEEYKNQRKTVPACYSCNQEYAKIDNKLRDVIGILNDGELYKSELTRRAVSNILSNKKELNNRLTFGNNGAEISFDRKILDKIHKKIFKGIYHLATNQPITNKYLLDVYSDGHDEKKLDLGFEFLTEIKNMGQWEKSGYSYVFEYELTYYNFENEKLEKLDKSNIEPLFLVCAMKYINTIVKRLLFKILKSIRINFISPKTECFPKDQR